MLSSSTRSQLCRLSAKHGVISKFHTTSVALGKTVVVKKTIKPKVPQNSPLYSFENMIKSEQMQIPKPVINVEDESLTLYTSEDKKYLKSFEAEFSGDVSKYIPNDLFDNILIVNKDKNLDLTYDHKQNNCLVIDGKMDSGRTTLLKTILLDHYLKNESIILPFPDPVRLYLEQDNLDSYGEQYVLLNITRDFIQTILKANTEENLKSIMLKNDYTFNNVSYQIGQPLAEKDITFVKDESSLFDLLSLKSTDEQVGLLLECVNKEILLINDKKVLILQDKANDLFSHGKTEYLDRKVEPIDLIKFQIPSMLLNFIQLNKENFTICLATNDDKRSKVLDLAISGDLKQINQWEENELYHENILNYLINYESGVKPKSVTVNNVDIESIKKLMICISSAGVMDRSSILPAEVYHLSGNGNIGESMKILTQWFR